MFILLGLTFAVGAVVGRARKPRVPAVGSLCVPPSVPWLLGIAAVLQAALRTLPAAWRSELGSAVVAASAFLVATALAMVVSRSRRLRVAAALALAGGGLNAAVMLVNGGMPVSLSAAEHLEPSLSSGDLSLGEDDPTARHVMVDENTRLTFLADVVPLRLGPEQGLLSAGDLVLLLATAVAAHAVARPSFRPESQGVAPG